jgi:xanthosine utilization system XapX-like protein
MHDAVGIALIVAGSVVGVVTAFVLRTRWPAPAVAVVLTACGVAIGAGALLVMRHVSATNWAVTIVLMAFLVPAHVRVVLGPLGKARSSG